MTWRMLLASIGARRGRHALALLAVTLGVTVAITLGTLALQAGDDFARALRAAGPNFVVLPKGANLTLDLGGVIVAPARAGLDLSENAVAEMRRSFWKHNLLSAAPEIVVAAAIDGATATLLGTWFERSVDTDGERWITGLRRLRPEWKLAGRWPHESAGEIALGSALAQRVGKHPGDRVSVLVSGRQATMLVTGVVEAGGVENRQAWAPIPTVRGLAARPAGIDRIWLSALVRPAPRTPAPDPERDPAGYERYMCAAYPDNVARELEERLGADVVAASEALAGEGRVIGRLNLLMALLATLAIVAAVLGLLSATTSIVTERVAELGLLSALGATPRQVATLLLWESVLVSLAGGVMGWLLGSVAATLIRGSVLGGIARAEPMLLLLALSLALVVALLGTLGSIRIALRIEPAAALRG